MKKSIQVNLGDRSYEVRIASDVLACVGEVADTSRAVVITESTVGPLYSGPVCKSLADAGIETDVIAFVAGETNKNLATCKGLYDDLFAAVPAVDRKTLIVGLGGGVATDVAGFIAATALRGLRWLACPTTLLAAVDASTGGKTGVDHQAGKNLIGAFHQPCGVLVDVETLRTLSVDELSNGLAECVKHAVIRAGSLLDFIESNAEALLAVANGQLSFDADMLVDLIARNVQIKADVVAVDETESGERAHLNFGHTIGHAIETCVGYRNIRHGEAVSLGMVAENALAVSRGLLKTATAKRIADALARLALPTRWPGLDVEAITQAMQHDKKITEGKIRFVLADKLGSVSVYDDVTSQEIQNAIKVLS